MGGRGTYSVGKNVAYTYRTSEFIEGIKVLRPIDKEKSFKLPDESHTAGNRYALLDKGGIFRQYREYDDHHQVVLEIGYHNEPSLGKGKVLHIHIYGQPGVEHHSDDTTTKRRLTRSEYQKYKYLFKGVKIDEGQYFD